MSRMNTTSILKKWLIIAGLSAPMLVSQLVFFNIYAFAGSKTEEAGVQAYRGKMEKIGENSKQISNRYKEKIKGYLERLSKEEITLEEYGNMFEVETYITIDDVNKVINELKFIEPVPADCIKDHHLVIKLMEESMSALNKRLDDFNNTKRGVLEANKRLEKNIPYASEDQIGAYITKRNKIVNDFTALTAQAYYRINGWMDELSRGRISKDEYYDLIIAQNKNLTEGHSKLLAEFSALIPPSQEVVRRHVLTMRSFKEGIAADKSGAIKDFEAELRHRRKSMTFLMQSGEDVKREIEYMMTKIFRD